MATRIDLPPGIRTAIEFNTYQVPAELGIDMPAQAASCVLGIEVEQFEAYLDHLEAEVRKDAGEMLKDREITAAIDRLELPRGGQVIAIGDSVTAYRRSHFDLLRVLVGTRRPDDGITFVNHAQSGYTSTHARRATYTTYIKERADLAVILLGGNDCERFGGEDEPTLVSPGEYRANIEAIVQAWQEHTQARLVMLSPVPVIPEMMRRVPDFARSRLTWNNTDLQVCADAMRSVAFQHDVPFVDLMEAFGPRPGRDLYFLDGIHPGPKGEELILRCLLDAL